MDETDDDFGMGGPQPGEAVWGQASAPHQRSLLVDGLKPSVTEGVAEVAVDAVIDRALVEPAVGVLVGEPLTTALSMARLLTSLVELTKGAPPPRSMGRASERVFGPGGPSATPRCCREAGARREACPMHPRPAMGL